MPLSPLTEQARADAREKALLARTHRQEIKQALTNRELTVRQVLDMIDTDPALKCRWGRCFVRYPVLGPCGLQRLFLN